MRTRTTIALSLLLALTAFLLLGRPGLDGDASTLLTRAPAPPEAPAELDPLLPIGETEGRAVLRGRPPEGQDESIPRGLRVVVRSEAGIRVPGAGVLATWSDGNGAPQEAEAASAADGSVFLADVPLDGCARVTVRTYARNHRSTQVSGELQVTGSELDATIPVGLPLRVRCVDDLTGRAMRDVAVRGSVPRPTVAEGFPEGDGWILALVGPDRKGTVHFAVEAPPGYVAWDPQRYQVDVGAWTGELEAVYPLRHEADVRVVVLDHEGGAESRAKLQDFAIAGLSVRAKQVDRLGPGVFQLRGVPFFRRALLTVTAYTYEPDAESRQSVALPASPAGRTEVLIRMPPPEVTGDTGGSTIGIGGGAGGSMGRRRGWNVRRGVAVVEVLRHDGSPASKARVVIGGRTARTDAGGKARIESIPIGEHAVLVHAKGLLPLSGVIYVTADKEARLVLQEPEGGAIDVYVTDARGDPLPFATIEVRTPSKSAWVDELDGRQRVDRFTDHEGHRRVGRVETGPLSIHAAWGGLEAEQKIGVHAGRLAEVTIVLR